MTEDERPRVRHELVANYGWPMGVVEMQTLLDLLYKNGATGNCKLYFDLSPATDQTTVTVRAVWETQAL